MSEFLGGQLTVLGVFEWVAVPTTLAWFLVCLVRGRRLRWPIVAMLIVGLTVAQPFGIVGTPITQAQYDTEAGASVRVTGWHVVRVGPVPVGVFRFYPQSLNEPFVDQALTGLRARSWLGPLTDGSQVGRIPFGSQGAIWSRAELHQAPDGKYVAVVGKPLGSVTPPYLEFSVGVASQAGLAYWIAATLLILTAAATRSERINEAVGNGRHPAPSPVGRDGGG